MAKVNLRLAENISGDFYVDSSCIDCDTCRWMTPSVFNRAAGQSVVYHQPTNETQRLRSLQALLACPTSSIGTVEKPVDITGAIASFPIPIAENVYHCGYHSEKSYGAASYLIVRTGGNVLVDSPRFAPPLVKRLEEMGGIRYLYLTHRDDVADHQKFHEYFKCDRILHSDDITTDTRNVETQLTGLQPFAIDSDLLIIPVPGHSKGHTVLLYKNFLFTGDHLAWSEGLQQLVGFPDVCWYSWLKQVESMRQLLHHSFEWVLPGHGRRYHGDAATMHQKMQQCVTWLSGAENFS